MLFRLMLFLATTLLTTTLIAQNAFVIPYGELTPSQKLQDIKAKSATQSSEDISYEQLKRNAYEDLKYYFKSHKRISISFGYYGYFGKETEHDYSYNFPKNKINEYGNLVLDSLPAGSYANQRIYETVPAMNIYITKEALEVINDNENITNISIDRRGSY